MAFLSAVSAPLGRRRSARRRGVTVSASARGRNDGRNGERRRYFATCARGLGNVLADEIRSSVTDDLLEQNASGVSFMGTRETGYRAAMFLRTATRVLEQIGENYSDTYDVYRAVRSAVAWENFIFEKQTFTVLVRSSGGRAHGIRTRVKDAICDELVSLGRGRPLPPDQPSEADVALFVSVHQENLVIYRDLGGDSLHKRGYRPRKMHASSLNECAAAAMALMADVANLSSRSLVVDPMCGSATLLIEAALLRLRVAPGLFRRRFSFENWPDFDKNMWNLLREEAQGVQLSPEDVFGDQCFVGNDIHSGSVELARENIDGANLGNLVAVHHKDVQELHLSRPADVVLSNPPWGLRLGEEEEAWSQLGRFLKSNGANGDAYLLCGNSEVSRHLRMKADRKWPVRLGDVDCRILKYHILPPKETVGPKPL
mmetsp:Transcript_5939/g.17867  ORF Transcript_5939/g.17867 Transcript_5939/m.17867 type:complete len:429 (-) Transcript_5939:1836-3122(-)